MENTKKQFMEDWKFVVMGKMKGKRKWQPMKLDTTKRNPDLDESSFTTLEEATKCKYGYDEAQTLQFHVDYADELNKDMVIKLELTWMGDK